MRKVYSIKISEIIEAPFSMEFGNKYNNYSTIGIKHVSGKVIHFLFDQNGECVPEENEVTDRIQKDFSINGNTPQFAKCLIDGVYCLALQLVSFSTSI